MGARIRSSTNNIPRLVNALQRLGRKEIQVGIFGDDDSDLVMIGQVHEYGMTITPKSGKYLAIPASSRSKGRSPRDFNDLFFIPSQNGNGVLARNVGRDRIDVLFVLVKSVTIPERSFLRTGFDENVDKIVTKMERELDKVLRFQINPDQFAEAIGREFAGLIQKQMRDLRQPPNANITVEVKRSSNPLMDTGRLVGAIRHEVK